MLALCIKTGVMVDHPFSPAMNCRNPSKIITRDPWDPISSWKNHLNLFPSPQTHVRRWGKIKWIWAQKPASWTMARKEVFGFSATKDGWSEHPELPAVWTDPYPLHGSWIVVGSALLLLDRNSSFIELLFYWEHHILCTIYIHTWHVHTIQYINI